MSDDHDNPYLPEDETVLKPIVEEAVAPYDRLLPPRLRAALREALADALATHPTTAPLVEQLAPAPVVDESGKVAKKDGTASEEAEPKAAGVGAKK